MQIRSPSSEPVSNISGRIPIQRSSLKAPVREPQPMDPRSTDPDHSIEGVSQRFNLSHPTGSNGVRTVFHPCDPQRTGTAPSTPRWQGAHRWSPTSTPQAPTTDSIIDSCGEEQCEHLRGYLFGRNGRNTVGHGRERMTVREGAPMSDSVSRCANLSRCCQDELQYAPTTNQDHTTVCKQR